MTDPTPREKLEKPTLIYPFAAAPETDTFLLPEPPLVPGAGFAAPLCTAGPVEAAAPSRPDLPPPRS